MRVVQDVMMYSYYWNDKNIKYLHEKIIKNNIGIYKGFFCEYGQALRIRSIDFLTNVEIVKKIKMSKVTVKNIIKLFPKKDTSKYKIKLGNELKKNIKSIINSKLCKEKFNCALEEHYIRDG